jgi:F-type H+-transporting ATPase subunit b
MTRKNRISVACSIFLALLLVAAQAGAAEEAANPKAAHFTEIFKWINFAIVVGLVIWVFAKLLPPKFRNDAATINAAIAKATAAKALADAQLRDAQAKLANLQKEVLELRALAERESRDEVERIHSATQTEVQKIAAAAKAEIEATERSARIELKALAAKLAVDGAETLLAKQLTPQAQESLINNFVKTLDGRPN